MLAASFGLAGVAGLARGFAAMHTHSWGELTHSANMFFADVTLAFGSGVTIVATVAIVIIARLGVTVRVASHA